MADNTINDELTKILFGAFSLASGWKHGIIDYPHLFVTMLQTDCTASPFVANINMGDWVEKVRKEYPVTDKRPGDTLPITVAAERVIRHASNIASIEGGEVKALAVHLLLAIASFENEVTTALNKSGVYVNDIAFAWYKKDVTLPAIISPIRTKAYSKMELMFMSATTKGEEVTKLHQNAYDLYTFGLYDECINVCNIGLGLSRANHNFRLLQAYSFMGKRDFAASLPLMVELAAENPENTDFRVSISFIQDELGNYSEAANVLTMLLAQEPDNTLALNNRGFNLLHQEKYAESIPYFEKAIKLDPSFAYPYNNMGFAMFKLGNVTKALALINESLVLDKGNSFAYKNKGIVYMEQGNKEEALKNFNLALKYKYTEKYGDEVNVLLQQLIN